MSSAAQQSFTAPGHIRVALRVRPLLPSEAERMETVAVTVTPSQHGAQAVQVLKPAAVSTTAVEQGKIKRGKQPPGTATVARTFAFDAVAGPDVSQTELFRLLEISSMCDDAFAGRAATVLCFGQTGGGKTYTLSGASTTPGPEIGADADKMKEGAVTAEDGLQFQAVRYMAAAQQRAAQPVSDAAGAAPSTALSPPRGADSARVTLKASYLELYNERLFDLLQQGKGGLKCRWSAAAQGFFVEDSLVVHCESEEDLLMVLREGHAYRHRAAHRLNAESSRSHAIFTVFVEARDPPTDADQGPPPVRYGKIAFVDLAGSERLKASGSSGEDSMSINRSLFALGNVIEKLSAQSDAAATAAAVGGGGPGGKPNGFIPYRSSILTQLLMDSLNGQSRTLMVACVSPSSRFVEESLQTLHYAQRARRITVRPPVRLDAAEEQRLRLQRELQRLRRENALLRAALKIPTKAEGEGDGRDELTAESIQPYVSALVSSALSAVAAGPLRSRPATSEDTTAAAVGRAPSDSSFAAAERAGRTVHTPPAMGPLRRTRQNGSRRHTPPAGRLPSLRVEGEPAPGTPAQLSFDPAERRRRRGWSRPTAVPDSSNGEGCEGTGEEGERRLPDRPSAAGRAEEKSLAVPPYPYPYPSPSAPPAVSALDLLDRLPDTVELAARKRS